MEGQKFDGEVILVGDEKGAGGHAPERGSRGEECVWYDYCTIEIEREGVFLCHSYALRLDAGRTSEASRTRPRPRPKIKYTTYLDLPTTS